MSKFEEQGYLSEETTVFVDHFEKTFSEWNDHCHALNAEAMGMLLQAKLDGGNEEKILANQLFIRILSNFQAAILMAKLGLAAEMRTIMRSMLEAVFVLQATEKSPGFVNSHLKHSMNEHRKYIQRLADLDIDGLDVSVDLAELSTYNKRHSIAALTTAKLAGMEFYYHEYSRLCMHTHPSAIGLIDHLKVNEAGIRTGTKFCPLYEDMDEDIFKATSTALLAMGSMNRLFSLDRKEQLRSLFTSNAEIHRKAREQEVEDKD